MTYVLSDIHGEYDLFCRLLDKVGFSDGDTLISCGDMIEKGKHSIRLVKLLFSMENAVLIAGNHEYDFLKYYWAIMRQTEDYDLVLRKLKAYFPDDGDLLDWETVDRMEALPYYYETEDFICVHAGVPLDREGHILPLGNAIPEQLVYDRTFKGANVLPKDGKCVFFGHTTSMSLGCGTQITKYLRDGKRGDHVRDFYKIHLDTGAWISGVLACFCVEDCATLSVTA